MPKELESTRYTNWKRVEMLYRTGLLSLKEIAKQTGCSQNAVRYRAEKFGWKRDLSHEVRKRTRTKIVESLAETFPGDGKSAIKALEELTDEGIIEQAAKTQVQVIRDHQKSIGHGHKLVMRMLDELDATTAYAGELQQLITSSIAPHRQEAVRRSVSLSSRIVGLRDLAMAARTWVALERQAFSIPDEPKGADNAEDESKTAEELRKEILDEAHKMGIELTNLGSSDAKETTH